VLRGYLHVEGRLVIVARGAWTTPYQRLPAQDWLDGEVHGTIGRTHFFLALRNLENESLASATYLAGEGMPLPFRSYQAGVEWHFLD